MSYTVGKSLCDASDAVSNSYSIDDNSGEQLNVIGRVLVETRGFIDTVKLDVYECNDDGDYECGDLSVQCSTTSIASDSELSDAYYKLLLKSKVAKNNNTCTCDDILKAIRIISPSANFTRVIDNYDMTVTIEYSGTIDSITEDLFIGAQIVPLPAGVSLRDVIKV